ncbi:MAG: TerC family protein [Sporocytophaga sp.]|uniref:TerC family protein n=1 Tax=Sporocytophaga sp. TaxID=2231183 RepID=UPI001B12BBCC|nr:TerC family protein [Sporocytophaga sp.]MBO9703061.1 TerC family protein [Sporocytophaga sp.]
MPNVFYWIFFNVFVLIILAFDLGVFHRKAHVVSFKESILWTVFWISLALSFNLIIYLWQGPDQALDFLTGYLIEKSLSIDNIFVILLIFKYVQVPDQYQHRVLFWGILGALVMRAIFIFLGIELLERFHWLVYIFGAFLIIIGIRMAVRKEKKVEPKKNIMINLVKRFIPATPKYDSDKFFIRIDHKRHMTPLFFSLIMIETTDLIFAVDSIPAILAITTDKFIVYTSNVFAILGLRSLYFAFAGLMQKFRYLHYGLASILVFVGVKMILTDIFKIPTLIALIVVIGILIVSIVGSVLVERNKDQKRF